MATANNFYASKVYSEHPIATWPLDEKVYYLSLIDDNDRYFMQANNIDNNWAIVNGTGTNTPTIPDMQSPINDDIYSALISNPAGPPNTEATRVINDEHLYIGSDLLASSTTASSSQTKALSSVSATQTYGASSVAFSDTTVTTITAKSTGSASYLVTCTGSGITSMLYILSSTTAKSTVSTTSIYTVTQLLYSISQAISKNITMTALSPDLFSISNLNASVTQFTINMFLYQKPPYINWFRLGYRYTYAGEEYDVFSDKITAPTVTSWANISQTFDLPSAWSGNIKIFLQVDFQGNPSMEVALRTIIMNGLSVGQNTISTCYESLGSTAISLPADTGIALSGVSADQYGVLADNGYYLVRNNTLLAHNDGMSIIFGTDHSTSIDPAGAGLPSLIFPGKGMLNETGRNKQYTFEMWLKIDPSTSTAERILGPLGSVDGIYVKEGFITLAIHNEIGSHFVSDWYRPMLMHLIIKENNATLMINGEQVINIPFDRNTVPLPNTTDWWGIYSVDTISYFNIDCISIFPYIVSEMVAKRRFVYGQGTPSIQSIDSSYQGTTTTIDFATSEYNSSIIYPDIARWDAGYFNNLTATRDYLSVPDYPLPNIYLGGRDLQEWYDDNYTINTSEYPTGNHPKFVSFRPNQVTRTNLCTNPSFSVGTAGWTSGANSSIARSTTYSLYGSGSLRVTRTNTTLGNCWGLTSFSAVPGKTYNLSVWVRCASGTVAGGVIYIGDGIANNSLAFTATTTWTRLTLSKTFSLNSSTGNVYIGIDNSAISGVQVYFDNVLIEEGSSALPYFDGSYIDPTINPIGTQAWTGTANASSSTVTTWNTSGTNYQDPSYFNFPSLNILNDSISAVYAVFEIESNIATTRPLMSFVNITNSDTFNISVNGNQVTYSINGVAIRPSDTINIGTEVVVGLNFDEVSTAFGYDVSRFFSSPSSVQLYVGGDGVDTFEGKIYAVGFCNDTNHQRLNPDADPNFDASGIALKDNAARFLDHFASYTLFTEYEYGTLFLDIAVQSEWEEYFPLSYFASYVKDSNGNATYDLDMLQLNIGYPTVISTAVWNYSELKTEFTTPSTYATLRDSTYIDYFGLKKRNVSGSTASATSSMKSYISFQSLADGANTPLDSITYSTSITENGVIYADQAAFPYNTKFAFKDDTIVFPPKNNFEDYAMVVHLEIDQRSIKKNPLKIKSMEISAKNMNQVSNTGDPSQRSYIGTKFGKKAYPVINALTNIDYKSQNPFVTYKTSSPYLYTTKKSGIRMISESNIVQSPAESYTFIPVNESGAFEYKVAAMQFMVRPDFIEDEETIKFIEIKHKNGYLLYALNKIGGSATMSAYEKLGEDVFLNGNSPTEPVWDYVYDGGTPSTIFPQVPYLDIQTGVVGGTPIESPYTDVYGTEFYQNGRYVQSPVLDNNEWATIGIVFPEQLDFSEYSDGGIRIYGGGLFNNISYYLSDGLGTKTDLTTRSWLSVLTADETVPTGTVWSYWAGNTWQYVYLVGQVSSYISTPADIYDAYVGTNAEIIDDGLGLSMNHRQAQIVSGATWSSFTRKPA